MSEIIKERLNNSIGKVVLVFTFNNFRYEGKVTNIDASYLEILDFRSHSYKIISLKEIKDLQIKEGDEHE